MIQTIQNFDLFGKMCLAIIEKALTPIWKVAPDMTDPISLNENLP